VSSLLTVQTSGAGFVDLTREVGKFLSEIGAREGALTLFIRHTSASFTIQENADPSMSAIRDKRTVYWHRHVKDILDRVDRQVAHRFLGSESQMMLQNSLSFGGKNDVPAVLHDFLQSWLKQPAAAP
jgi:thiamine phosphate synthase YjbQ (UPF0047 family)